MAQQLATPLELRLVELINEERAANGLPPVNVEVHLNAAAQSHTDWMATTGILSHTGQGGSSASERIEDADFPLEGSWRTAENIAYVSITGIPDRGEADAMHQNLMDSPGHRANILQPDVLYVGIGLSQGVVTQGSTDHDVLFLTQNFANTEGVVSVQKARPDGWPQTVDYEQGAPVGVPVDVAELPDPQPPVFDRDGPVNPTDPTDPDDEEDPQDPDTGGGGGCFVATAAYGGRSHPDVVALRRFRDETLIRYRAGRAFVRAYWAVGPLMARRVSPSGLSGRALRTGLSALVRRLPR